MASRCNHLFLLIYCYSASILTEMRFLISSWVSHLLVFAACCCIIVISSITACIIATAVIAVAILVVITIVIIVLVSAIIIIIINMWEKLVLMAENLASAADILCQFTYSKFWILLFPICKMSTRQCMVTGINVVFPMEEVSNL
jgi:hypothetical protein